MWGKKNGWLPDLKSHAKKSVPKQVHFIIKKIPEVNCKAERGERSRLATTKDIKRHSAEWRYQEDQDERKRSRRFRELT